MANVKFTDLPNLGNITANTIVPVVEANVNYTVTAANLTTYVNTNSGQITANGVSTTGNVTAGAYFVGDGSQLTNLPQSYGNANVAAYLPTFSGNLAAGNVSATGNVSGNYFVGNGSQLTGLPATYNDANVASFLSNLGANSISTTGNVTAGYLFGNISGATGGYGNANVQAVLQTYSGTLTAASVSATGNVTGNFFVGNGSQLTGISASLSGNMSGNINGNAFNITNLLNLSATGNVTGTHRGDGSNLTGIPTSIIAGTGISVSAATGAVTITNNNPTPYANANVAAYLLTNTGNIAAGNVSATGNVTGANITGTHFGNGAGLSNIVTSIIAGSGISINQSTGAVTITNTGGGGGGSSGKIASSVSTGTFGFGTTTTSLQATIPAGTFVTGDVVEIYAQWINNNDGSDQRFGNIYIGPNSGTTIGATQVYSGITSSIAESFAKIATRLEILNSTSTRYFFNSSGAMNSLPYATGLGIAPNLPTPTANINWGVTQYVMFTGRNALGGGVAGLACAGYQIYKA